MDINGRINSLSELNITSITELLKDIKNINENRPEDEKLNAEELLDTKEKLYKILMARVKEIIENNELRQEESQEYITAIREGIKVDIGEEERNRIANEIGFTEDGIQFAQRTDTEEMTPPQSEQETEESQEEQEEHDYLADLQNLINRAKTEEVNNDFWVNVAIVINRIRNSSLSSEKGEQFRTIINDCEVEPIKYIAAGHAYDSIYNAEELNLSLYELYNDNKEVLENEQLRGLDPISRPKPDGYEEANEETKQEADRIIEEYDSRIAKVNKEIYDLTKEIEEMERVQGTEEQQDNSKDLDDLTELESKQKEIRENDKSYETDFGWISTKRREEELEKLVQNIDYLDLKNIEQLKDEVREMQRKRYSDKNMEEFNELVEKQQRIQYLLRIKDDFYKNHSKEEIEELDKLIEKHKIEGTADLNNKFAKEVEIRKNYEEVFLNENNQEYHQNNEKISKIRIKLTRDIEKRINEIDGDIERTQATIDMLEDYLHGRDESDPNYNEYKTKLEEAKNKQKELQEQKKELEEIIKGIKKEPLELTDELKEKLNKYKDLLGKDKNKSQEEIDAKKAELAAKKEERNNLIAEKKQRLSELLGRTREHPEEQEANKEKLFYKALLGLGGFALGFGLSYATPGIGTIRMGAAIVKITTSIIDKASGGAITNISNRFTESLKENHPRIAAGLERINKVMQSGYFQWFVNGVSVGYVAGNLVEFGKPFFEKLTQKAGTESEKIIYKPLPRLKDQDKLFGLHAGQEYDLGNIARGYGNSFTDKSVKIMNDTVGKKVIFEKMNNGYAHFLQPDGKGYAWIKLEELQQQAPEIFGGIAKHTK